MRGGDDDVEDGGGGGGRNEGRRMENVVMVAEAMVVRDGSDGGTGVATTVRRWRR